MFYISMYYVYFYNYDSIYSPVRVRGEVKVEQR